MKFDQGLIVISQGLNRIYYFTRKCYNVNIIITRHGSVILRIIICYYRHTYLDWHNSVHVNNKGVQTMKDFELIQSCQGRVVLCRV